jgi:hypothetical protein
MAAERNIVIYKGDSYLHEVRLKDSANVAINVTNRIYTSQIRKARSSDDVIATFTITITTPSTGVLSMSLDDSITSNITSGTYYYDLQEENSGIITTLMGGKAVVKGEVSRG